MMRDKLAPWLPAIFLQWTVSHNGHSRSCGTIHDGICQRGDHNLFLFLADLFSSCGSDAQIVARRKPIAATQA